MMTEYEVEFPQYLSAPIQILKWESDEIAIAVGCYLLTLMIGKLLWPGVIAGPWYYIILKRRYPRGFLRHAFYYVGITRFHGYPEHFVTTFQE